MARKLVVLGFLGTTLDAGRGPQRWDRWRPSVALSQHEDLLIDRIELWHPRQANAMAETVVNDVSRTSPDTRVVRHAMEFEDAWSFEHVYAKLHDFAKAYPFDTEREDYLVHITTGTHVAQICLFLLTEARYFPARLLQTSPGRQGDKQREIGTYSIIDLDLSRYDQLASRFRKEQHEGQSFLKSGIDTKNAGFNQLIERIEHVAIASRAPLLLTGPTGAGKSHLARRIFELKKSRRQVSGAFAEVNCATLRGDAAMSTLFGHVKGAFTGAAADRAGLLKKADQGVLFLDEIAELGLDEQAMLLRAIEEKVFTPMGSDKEVRSDFQLLTGTHRNLRARVAEGRFREDLHARIDLWHFELPALHARPEDLEPNLDFELGRASSTLGVNVTLSREARTHWLAFARMHPWPGNFRELNACVTRMATLASGGRITTAIVKDEAARLRGDHAPLRAAESVRVLGEAKAEQLDRFDRVQLEDVLAVCRSSASLSAAGRELFAASLRARTSVNDADRLRKYLARFDLDFARVRGT